MAAPARTWPRKPATANLAADCSTKGAGDLDSKTSRTDGNHAIELGFRSGATNFTFAARSQRAREEAFDLLKLALRRPLRCRNVERGCAGQGLSALRRDTHNPNTIASIQWWADRACPDGHPYEPRKQRHAGNLPARHDSTTCAAMSAGLRAALRIDDFDQSAMSDAKTAGELIDRAFGSLPAKNDLNNVAAATPRGSAGASSSISTYRRRW